MNIIDWVIIKFISAHISIKLWAGLKTPSSEIGGFF